jgi:hypothetical protein
MGVALMAVREFDGIDDAIDTATGALSGMTHGTFAAMFKLSVTSVVHAFGHLHNSGGSFLGSPLNVDGANFLQMWSTGGSNSSFTVTSGVWYLAVGRKVTGTAAARYSLLNMNTSGWTHGNGGAAIGNWSAPGVSGTLRFNFQNSGDWFNGLIAVRAGWSNSLPYSADATGDAAIEVAGFEDSLQRWVDAAPSALWVFNQADVATAVEDITGTSVVTGDDPPGFGFTLGGEPPVLEEGPQQLIQRSNLRLG